jgi:hypothetical protein
LKAGNDDEGRRMERCTEALLGALLTVTLAACSGSGGGAATQPAPVLPPLPSPGSGVPPSSDAAPPPSESTPPPSPGSAAPSISGSPPKTIVVTEQYVFTPSASDPDGDRLTFSVAQKPDWLTFNPEDGTLTGTPDEADIGTYRGIVLSVSDGQHEAILPPFDIAVPAIGSRNVTLSWIPPTENEDGSPLTDLAGYEIAYGRQSGMYSSRIDVGNPGVTTYVVSGLVPGEYFFTMLSYNEAKVRSRVSEELAINVQ